MAELSYDGIYEEFMRITGLSEDEFSYGSLIENASQYISSRLKSDIEELSEAQENLCVYAAAAVAVYDYAFEARLKRIQVLSENGSVISERPGTDIENTASKLRFTAIRQLASAGLTDPDDFAFIGV